MKTIAKIENESSVAEEISSRVKPEKIASMEAWLNDVMGRASERCEYDDYVCNGYYDYELSCHETVSGHTESISVELEWADIDE